MGRILTRRDFLGAVAAAAVPDRLVVPLHRVTDRRAQCPPEHYQRFWSGIWPEAFRTFRRGGIDLQTSDSPGEIRRSAGDKPVFVGLRRGVLNLVLTDHIPMKWEKGRALAGATTIYQGYHVCLVALLYAHGNQAPFLSVNTCVHEILHALLQDVFLKDPQWLDTGEREFSADWHATRLWLFGDGAAVRKSARAYLARLAA